VGGRAQLVRGGEAGVGADGGEDLVGRAVVDGAHQEAGRELLGLRVEGAGGLEARLAQLPDAPRTWVHCAAGFRAGTAASILADHGRTVVHVDDGFEHAVELGLT
jgi:rhodanese-related sulfurtransferase